MTASTDADTAHRLTISETADACGVSVDTLRYYERAGVLPEIDRNTAGQRLYTTDDLGWVTFVRRLRATGMPMQRIATYVTMVRDGEGTIAQRRQLLDDHRATVAAAITELNEVLAMLDRKIAHYTAAEAGVDLDCSVQPLRHVPQLS